MARPSGHASGIAPMAMDSETHSERPCRRRGHDSMPLAAPKRTESESTMTSQSDGALMPSGMKWSDSIEICLNAVVSFPGGTLQREEGPRRRKRDSSAPGCAADRKEAARAWEKLPIGIQAFEKLRTDGSLLTVHSALRTCQLLPENLRDNSRKQARVGISCKIKSGAYSSGLPFRHFCSLFPPLAFLQRSS